MIGPGRRLEERALLQVSRGRAHGAPEDSQGGDCVERRLRKQTLPELWGLCRGLSEA